MAGYFTTKKLVDCLNVGFTLTYATNTPTIGRSRIQTDHSVYSFRTGGQWEEKTETQQLTDLSSGISWKDFISDFDTGHPFQVTKYDQKFSHPLYTTFVGNKGQSNYRYYSGPLLLQHENQAYPSIPSFNSSLIGNRLVANARPTAPTASLAVAMIEFWREGLPTLPGSEFLKKTKETAIVLNNARVKSIRDVTILKASKRRNPADRLSGEFLNYIYGFEALARDMATLLTSVLNVNNMLMQYKKDSGQIVRRRRGIPRTVDSTYQTNINPNSYFSSRDNSSDISGGAWSDLYVGAKQFSTVDLAYSGVEDVWWSGEFQYFIHEGNTPYDRFIRYSEYAHKLLGTGITPSTLYNAAPWTWLADWFYDVGSLLGAAGADDASETITRYSYLMRHFRGTNTYINSSLGFLNRPAGTVWRSYSVERKERFRGTPFGFGLSPSTDFSARQWAILGFLGLTLGSKAMRYFE